MPLVSILTPVKATTPSQVQWLIEAIESVKKQTVPLDTWEMIIVDDSSAADLKPLTDYIKSSGLKNVHGAKCKGSGAVDARNQAAQRAKGELLLPLDADDKLPAYAIETLLKGWDNDGKQAGIVYGDVLYFGQDLQREFTARTYDFATLLSQLFMPVGSLHSKESWTKVGGWKSEMSAGLEDWEYWIALGELGVCGMYIPEVLYHYRRHGYGRLASLRSSIDGYQKAYAQMRDLHRDSYSGRFPMGCCGKSNVRYPAPVAAAALSATPMQGSTQVLYVGGRKGSFCIVGRASGIMYQVNGRGNPVTTMEGQTGVDQRDVPYFKAINSGRDFQTI